MGLLRLARYCFDSVLGWLEHWLDEQIKFDTNWEKKVADRILHNLSLLFDQTFNNVKDLNLFRKKILREIEDLKAKK